MEKIPINITKNDLSINQDIVCLKFNGGNYEGIGHKLPFYSSDVAEIKKKDEKLKILRFLFTNKFAGLLSIHFHNSAFYPKRHSALNTIEAQHDPVPDHLLEIYPFSSLQSIQWHLLSHGIADYWLNPFKPYLLSGIIDEYQMEVDWHNFMKRLSCERWSIDLPNLPENERKSKWNEILSSIQEKYNTNCHGCFNCINEQGADKFISCCRFFEEYRMAYLKRIRGWIVDTIQDNNNLEFYRKNQKNVDAISPARRHIHLKDTKNCLYAYVIDKGSDGNVDIYCMKFKRIKSVGNSSKYRIITAYGLSTKDSEEKAKQHMLDHVRNLRKVKKLQIINYCHPENWHAII